MSNDQPSSSREDARSAERRLTRLRSIGMAPSANADSAPVIRVAKK
jgi:hypothetical protein